MIQGNKDDARTNGEGYVDPTAYEAVRRTEVSRYAVKKFLWGYLRATRELERLDNEVKDLEEERDMLSVKLDGMPRGSEISDRTGNLASKIADMHMDAITKRAEVWERRKAINDLINSLNSVHRKILYDHFIMNKTFEQIAVDMGYSFRHLMRLYNDALDEAGRKMS